MPDSHVLWLFDREENYLAINDKIRDFLREHLASRENTITDLLLYYTGHGTQAGTDRKLKVILSATNRDNIEDTAYPMETLARTLHREAQRLHKWIILDCCWAGAATPDLILMSATDIPATMHGDTVDWLPAHRTALLCASMKDQVALAPETESCTLFSGALLDVLESGVYNMPELMTLENISSSVETRIKLPDADPDKQVDIPSIVAYEGDLAVVPFFPNPSALPERLHPLIEHGDPVIREGAVRILGDWLLSPDAKTSQAARFVLETMKKEALPEGPLTAIEEVFQVEKNLREKDGRISQAENKLREKEEEISTQEEQNRGEISILQEKIQNENRNSAKHKKVLLTICVLTIVGILVLYHFILMPSVSKNQNKEIVQYKSRLHKMEEQRDSLQQKLEKSRLTERQEKNEYDKRAEEVLILQNNFVEEQKKLVTGKRNFKARIDVLGDKINNLESEKNKYIKNIKNLENELKNTKNKLNVLLDEKISTSKMKDEETRSKISERIEMTKQEKEDKELMLELIGELNNLKMELSLAINYRPEEEARAQDYARKMLVIHVGVDLNPSADSWRSKTLRCAAGIDEIDEILGGSRANQLKARGWQVIGIGTIRSLEESIVCILHP